MSELYNWIGKKIASIRQEQGLSQTQLADKIGLTRSSVANIEKARQFPPIHILFKISVSLSISIEDIIPTKSQHLNENSGLLEEIERMQNLDEDDKGKLVRFVENL